MGAVNGTGEPVVGSKIQAWLDQPSSDQDPAKKVVSDSQGPAVRAEAASKIRERIQELEIKLPAKKSKIEGEMRYIQERIAEALTRHVLGEITDTELEDARREMVEVKRFLEDYPFIILGLKNRFKFEQQKLSAAAGESIRAAESAKFPGLKVKLQKDFLNGVIPGTYYFGENCEILLACGEKCGRELEAKTFIERFYRAES